MTTIKTLRRTCSIVLGFAVAAALIPKAMAQTVPAGTKNILLIHGAWADGSSWSKVIPLLEARGYHVVSVQIPLTSLADDVAATKRAIALQDGPLVLVGHSYGGVVITQAGSDPKVASLVYVSAFAPAEGESVGSISKPYPQTPIGAEIRPDSQGFLSITSKGIAEDFAQDLSDREKQLLAATQIPVNVTAFGTPVTTAAWKTKPNWFMVAANDRVISPELEKAEAQAMKATTVIVPSSHVIMLSHPKETADVISDAAEKSGNH